MRKPLIGLVREMSWVNLIIWELFVWEAITLSKRIACKLGGGKAPRLSEVHCDRDSVCVKTDT